MKKQVPTIRSMSGQHPDQLTHLSHALKQRARDEGFDPVGIARLPGSPRLQLRTEALQRWLEHGYQADMAWMAAHADAMLLNF
jgi:epoxyqueuosine reductase